MRKRLTNVSFSGGTYRYSVGSVTGVYDLNRRPLVPTASVLFNDRVAEIDEARTIPAGRPLRRVLLEFYSGRRDEILANEQILLVWSEDDECVDALPIRGGYVVWDGRKIHLNELPRPK